MITMMRVGCLIRRKRSLALYGCVGIVVLCSLTLLTGTYQGSYPMEKASNYDLAYNFKKADEQSWINEGNYIDEGSVVRNSVAMQQGVDRKPQAQVVKDGDAVYSVNAGRALAKRKVKYRFQRDGMGEGGIDQLDQYQSEDMYDKDRLGEADDRLGEADDDVNAIVIQDEEEEEEDYEEDDYDYFQSNPFKEGDFDNAPLHHTKPPFRFKPPDSSKQTSTSIKDGIEKSSAQLVPSNDRTMREKSTKSIALSAGFEVNAGRKQAVLNGRQAAGFGVSSQGRRVNGPDTPLSAATKTDTNRAIRQENGRKPCETNTSCDIPKVAVKTPTDDKPVPSLSPGMSAKSAARRGSDVKYNAQVVTKSEDKGSQHIPKNKNDSSEWAEDLPDNVASKIETQIPIQEGLGRYPAVQQQPATQIQIPELSWQPGQVRSKSGTPLVTEKIFWSKEVEQLVPKGKFVYFFKFLIPRA